MRCVYYVGSFSTGARASEREEEHMQTQPPPSRPGQADTQQGPPPARPPDGSPTAPAVTATSTIIGWVLQGGVLLSAAVIVVAAIEMVLHGLLIA